MKFYEDGEALTDPQGFFCSGVHCDVKGARDGKLDLGIIYSKKPCNAAGVFTTNDVQAAPVRYSKKLLEDGENTFHAILANSGNANACTGKQGENDNLKMVSEVARQLNIKKQEVLVCSTGRIGIPLPMSRLTAGIRDASEDIIDECEGAKAFQEAILTSDTCTKSCSAKIKTSLGEVTIGGVVKGAGMIEPNMATMLAFITTDIEVKNKELKRILTNAVDHSFNRITIDGDMSTNDTVLILANGASGCELSKESKSVQKSFAEAVNAICSCLARKCVTDGEKVTKFVKVKIKGAKDTSSAMKVARCISNSLLVKSSWYGSDPNWGRIIDAAGYAKVGLSFEKLSMLYNECPVLKNGTPLVENKSKWKEIVSTKEFSIILELNMGNADGEVWSNDLSEEYVNFNKSE
jgi:glutamate N-acetyltransferase / amino-acid N-acetyltransferase